MSITDPNKDSVLITVQNDPQFVRYRKKIRTIGVLLISLIGICMVALALWNPLSSSVEKSIAPYGLDNYFAAKIDDGLVSWRAGAAKYEDFVPDMSDMEAGELGKNVYVYADEWEIIDIVSESEIKYLTFVRVAENGIVLLICCLLVFMIIRKENDQIETYAANRLGKMAEEIKENQNSNGEKRK